MKLNRGEMEVATLKLTLDNGLDVIIGDDRGDLIITMLGVGHGNGLCVTREPDSTLRIFNASKREWKERSV